MVESSKGDTVANPGTSTDADDDTGDAAADQIDTGPAPDLFDTWNTPDPITLSDRDVDADNTIDPSVGMAGQPTPPELAEADNDLHRHDAEDAVQRRSDLLDHDHDEDRAHDHRDHDEGEPDESEADRREREVSQARAREREAERTRARDAERANPKRSHPPTGKGKGPGAA